MIESREGCDPLELTRRRRGQIPLRTTLSQIPLKSFGFPGAESARKRFFLRGQAPTPKKSARFHRTCRWKRLEVERVHTLSSSPGAVLLKDWFPTKQAILLRTLFPTTRAWGAPLPYTPSGDGVREGCDPLALSRSCSDGSSGFRRRGRGALRFPTPPSGDGRREGCDPLALSRSCSDESVGFRRNGRGALCSPAPPRVTGVREGCDPLALSRSCSDEGLVFDKVVLVRFISFRAYASISRSPSYKGGFKDVLIPDSMPVGCVCPVGEL